MAIHSIHKRLADVLHPNLVFVVDVVSVPTFSGIPPENLGDVITIGFSLNFVRKVTSS